MLGFPFQTSNTQILGLQSCVVPSSLFLLCEIVSSFGWKTFVTRRIDWWTRSLFCTRAAMMGRLIDRNVPCIKYQQQAFPINVVGQFKSNIWFMDCLWKEIVDLPLAACQTKKAHLRDLTLNSYSGHFRNVYFKDTVSLSSLSLKVREVLNETVSLRSPSLRALRRSLLSRRPCLSWKNVFKETVSL